MLKRIVSSVVILVVVIQLTLITSTMMYIFRDNETISSTERTSTEEKVKYEITMECASNETMAKETPIQEDEEIKLEKLNSTENRESYFSADITFTREYIWDGEVMPYTLFTPSTTEESGKKPLIVWLHGSGEVNADINTFFNRGLPETINSWETEGFDAYIICPHLTSRWNSGSWNTESAKNNLQALMEKFIMQHNIDTENIIIAGHSLGGQGALYMAHELQDYFSRCVVLSGYRPGTDNSEIDIPTIGYVGTSQAGEDSASISYMDTSFAPIFGNQNLFSIEASHGQVPKVAFNIDANNNNRSDLLEWMFGELELSNIENS